MKREAGRPRFRHRMEYALLRIVTTLLRLVPLNAARRFGEWIGLIGYWPFRVRRRTVERQVAAAFPDLGTGEVRRISRGAYRHLGRVAIELSLMPHLDEAGLRTLFEAEDDLGLIQRLTQGGRPIVACTGHFGNWELAGAFLAMHGVPIDAVVRRMANPLFDGFLNRTRSRTGMRVIYDRDAVRALTRGLKEGRVPALVADQGVLGLASSYVTFFGRPAKTPRGPAVFALRFDAPVVFAAAVLQPSRKYRFVALEVPVTQTGDREADVDAVVQSFTATLERLVRQYPEQYFWHHRRWKRQPADTPLELRDPVAVP